MRPQQGPRNQADLSWGKKKGSSLEWDRKTASMLANNVATRKQVAAEVRQKPKEPADLSRHSVRDLRGSRDPLSARCQEFMSRRSCGNCGVVGHTIRHCVHPSADGFVHGCPSCNTTNHERRKDCPNAPSSLETLLERAVTDRQHRPPLAAYRDWLTILKQAIDGGLALPTSFPWMPSLLGEFRTTFAPGEFPWETYSYTQNSLHELPSDSKTRYLALIRRDFDALSREMEDAPMETIRPRNYCAELFGFAPTLRYTDADA